MSTTSVRYIVDNVDAAIAEVADAQPGTRTLSYPSTANRAFVGRDGRTTFALVYLPGYQPSDATSAINRETAILHHALPGATAQVTGVPALSGSSGGNGTGVLAEVLMGALERSRCSPSCSHPFLRSCRCW